MKITTTFLIQVCYIVVGSLLFVNLTVASLHKIPRSEKVHSEANFFYDDRGKIYCDAIVIKFKNRVLDLPQGTIHAAKNNISQEFFNILDILNHMETSYGSVDIVKMFPDAVWGNIWKKHKITGANVQIHERSQVFTLKLPTPFLLDSLADVFRELPEIEYVERPLVIEYCDSPNDPYFTQSYQWNLQVTNSVGAWDITKGSSQTKVAIIDEGAMSTHPDLQGKIVGGDNISGIHGTWVAGVIGAQTNNTIGVASMGWNTPIISYGDSDIVQSIIDASAQTDIINLSWLIVRDADEGDDPGTCPTWVSHHRWEGQKVPTNSGVIQDAIEDVQALGVICVASAGNNSGNYSPVGCDPWTVPYTIYPASYSNVIAVSGTRLVGSSEQFRDGYNFGNHITVSGPADFIWTTNDNDLYGVGDYHNPSGTSFSSPLVASLVALIKSLNSFLAISEIKTILTSTTDKIDNTRFPYDANGWNNHLGYGRINAYKAIK